MREDVELFATEQTPRAFADTTASRQRRLDGGHGRIESRNITVIHDVKWLRERHQWPGLNGLVMVESAREILGPKSATARIERETRFYITSLTLPAAEIGPFVRDHRAVENALHRVLDMVFRDDECRLRTEQAPANFTTLKHMALNLLRRAPGKDSLRLKRKLPAWDDQFLITTIARN